MGEKSASCLANIGPGERRKRSRVGWSLLVVSALLLAVLFYDGAPRVWRVVVFLPLCVSMIGLFQAKEQTCIKLAARGTRNLDTGEEPITDPAERQRIRGQARKVWAESLVLAALLSAAAVALP